MGTKLFRGIIGLGFAAAVLAIAGGGQPASAQATGFFPLYSISQQCPSNPGPAGFGTDIDVSCDAAAHVAYAAIDADGSADGASTASNWLLFGGATVIALTNFAVAGRKIAAHATIQANSEQ